MNYNPSAIRHILSFECGEPFVLNGVEFTVIKVHGKSFMLHHIRKMLGLALAVVRELVEPEIIATAFTQKKVFTPMVPALGLVLDQQHFRKYDRNFGSIHGSLEFAEHLEAVEDFREKFIHPVIINTEIETNSMVGWLETIGDHNYNGTDKGTGTDSDPNERVAHVE